MAVPEPLRASLYSPAFWARYTFAHQDGPGSDRLGDLSAELHDDEPDDTPLGVEFDVGGGFRAVLSVYTYVDLHSLEIAGPDWAGEAGLGWDDMIHWHPYALRWSELDLICRAIAVLDPELPHPGAPLALLCRFAAVFEDDDVDGAVTAVDDAYTSLRPRGWDGYWPQATDWLEGADFRGQRVTWQRSGAGHLWARQDDDQEKYFYSTRVDPALDVFPYARLEALLAAAAATVEEEGNSGGWVGEEGQYGNSARSANPDGRS